MFAWQRKALRPRGISLVCLLPPPASRREEGEEEEGVGCASGRVGGPPHRLAPRPRCPKLAVLPLAPVMPPCFQSNVAGLLEGTATHSTWTQEGVIPPKQPKCLFQKNGRKTGRLGEAPELPAARVQPGGGLGLGHPWGIAPPPTHSLDPLGGTRRWLTMVAGLKLGMFTMVLTSTIVSQRWPEPELAFLPGPAQGNPTRLPLL